jgi:hypothetical protein
MRYSWQDASGWHGENVTFWPALAAEWSQPSEAVASTANPARTELLNWLLSSIAIDPDGHAHIAWTRTNDIGCCGPAYTRIWYQTRADTGWTMEAAGPEVGDGPSLDIDGVGRPYIAYANAWDGYTNAVAIHCVTKDALGWSVTVVDSPAAEPPALRVDPAGVPHVAYNGPGGLRYASFGSGGWTTELVTSTGTEPSLAFGSDGEPRIAFVTYSGSVGYSEHHLGSWLTTVVDSTSGRDLDVSLAVSPGGEPRIAYESQLYHRPWFTERNDGVWTHGAIDPTADGVYTQVGVDAVGHVVVAYESPTTEVLRWAAGSHTTGVGDGLGPPPPLVFAITTPSPIHVGESPRIRFTSPRAGVVRFEWFDVGGRRVASYETAAVRVGDHVVTPPVDLPYPGVFEVRARDAVGATAITRLIVIR